MPHSYPQISTQVLWIGLRPSCGRHRADWRPWPPPRSAIRQNPRGVVHPGSVPRVDSGPAADTVLPDQCKPLIQSGTSQRWRARSALRVASSRCLLHCLGKAGVRLRGWCQTPLHARHAGQPVGRFVYAPTPCCAAAAAPQMPVEQLPESNRVYLLGSHCCETDWLSQIAWLHCGHVPPSGPGCRASATWSASTLRLAPTTPAAPAPPGRPTTSPPACAATTPIAPSMAELRCSLLLQGERMR